MNASSWGIPTISLGSHAKPAALNARRFWTNPAAVRVGEPAAASLNGTRPGLGGRSCDRIGWGRLRSSASAGRCGATGRLHVVPAGISAQCQLDFPVHHFGQHDDSLGGVHSGRVSRVPGWICDDFQVQVSGDRIRRHIGSHLAPR